MNWRCSRSLLSKKSNTILWDDRDVMVLLQAMQLFFVIEFKVTSDYFTDPPVFRRFQMNRSLFLHILSLVEAYDPYFIQKPNVGWVIGLSSLHKIITAMSMLAHGVAADCVDDYMRIRKSTAIESSKSLSRQWLQSFHMSTWGHQAMKISLDY